MSVINYEPGERPYEKYAGYLDRQGTGCDSWDELTEDEKAAWAEVELPEPYKPDAAPPPDGDALAQLAASWETGVASIRNAYECDPVEMVRDCARQLRDLIGETGNDQLVGRDGHGTISVMLPMRAMTREQALRHAAWLVAIADDDDKFPVILSAVRST